MYIVRFNKELERGSVVVLYAIGLVVIVFVLSFVVDWITGTKDERKQGDTRRGKHVTTTTIIYKEDDYTVEFNK